MAAAERIRVTVVYALPDEQPVVVLEVPAGTTAYEAALLSGLAGRYGLKPDELSLGIFSKIEKAPGQRVLREGDRVEIYRPLLIDPKVARQARADKLRAAKGRK